MLVLHVVLLVVVLQVFKRDTHSSCTTLVATLAGVSRIQLVLGTFRLDNRIVPTSAHVSSSSRNSMLLSGFEQLAQQSDGSTEGTPRSLGFDQGDDVHSGQGRSAETERL
jgi:hypothetical protein